MFQVRTERRKKCAVATLLPAPQAPVQDNEGVSSLTLRSPQGQDFLRYACLTNSFSLLFPAHPGYSPTPSFLQNSFPYIRPCGSAHVCPATLRRNLFEYESIGGSSPVGVAK